MSIIYCAYSIAELLECHQLYNIISLVYRFEYQLYNIISLVYRFEWDISSFSCCQPQ